MNDSAVTVKTGPASAGASWLVLIHQIPPKPDYFRVKVRRRLERIGAVPLKNSVYVLPQREETLEDFRWLLREIVSEGGDATLCEAAVLEGLSQADLEGLFRTARDADYSDLTTAAEQVGSTVSKSADSAGELEAELVRLRRQLEQIRAIDYFGAKGRAAAERALARLEDRLSRPKADGRKGIHQMQGHTWVTRRNVFVDRIASAWLIRRFIDPSADFKFVEGRSYRPREGEVRFDMFDAEYTHEGELCTFQTLVLRAGLRDRALRAMGEIVHDIDCKDAKFGRDEAPGVAALIRGLVRTHTDDASRLARGGELMDQLYASLR